jgi:hypothetical protein
VGSEFVVGRGDPWDHDAGPPCGRRCLKFFMPQWAYELATTPLTAEEQEAVDKAPR